MKNWLLFLSICLALQEVNGWYTPPQLNAVPGHARNAPSLRDLCMTSSRESGQGREPMTRREAVSGLVIAGATTVATTPAKAAEKKKKKPVLATDKEMTLIKAQTWMKKHPNPGSRDLVVGLGEQPYWLIAGKQGTIEAYALRAECTHLGCLADYRPSEQKHICPCHGSQYDKEGRVLRGPAPRSLDLAKVEVLEDGTVRISEWDAADFRDSANAAKA